MEMETIGIQSKSCGSEGNLDCTFFSFTTSQRESDRYLQGLNDQSLGMCDWGFSNYLLSYYHQPPATDQGILIFLIMTGVCIVTMIVTHSEHANDMWLRI